MFGHTVDIVSIYGEIYSHSFVRVTRKDNGMSSEVVDGRGVQAIAAGKLRGFDNEGAGRTT
jgi:hypothetical protein